jgi:mono/diheme cytochrome c family protein
MTAKMMTRSFPFLFICLLIATATNGLASEVDGFLKSHCFDCHQGLSSEGGRDLTSLSRDFTDPVTLAIWVRIHDRVSQSEMPPVDHPQPATAARSDFLRQLRQRLHQADSLAMRREGRVGLRRMTRKEFQNTLQDLLALPRLDILGLLPSDGRVGGYTKIGSALEISPAHIAAYEEAIDKALDSAIATRSARPPVFRRRVYPAGLFTFGANLIEGPFVRRKDKKPDPAFPVRGGMEDRSGYVGFEGPDLEERRKLLDAVRAAGSTSAVGLLNPNLAGYEAAMNVAPIYPGMYRLKISLWGFQWNQGSPEPCNAPQAAALRAHEEGKQQEGGRLLQLLTAPSMQPHEVELNAWLEARESIVFDPVSIPWNGLRIGQVAGRAAMHRGPGVAIDWFEIEGPIHDMWPPASHRQLFGDLAIGPIPEGSSVIAPRRESVRGIGGYLPNFYTDIPASERQPILETVQSSDPMADGRKLLGDFLPKAFRRPVQPTEIEPYLQLLWSRLETNDCFEDAMRRVYVAVLTSPEFLLHPGDQFAATPDDIPKTLAPLASRFAYWLWNGPPDESLLSDARDGRLGDHKTIRRQVDRMLADPRSDRFIDDFADQWLELDRISETTPDPKLYPEYRFLLHEGLGAETKAFLREMIERDLPVVSLLKPGFAMVNQRVAEHYGLEGIHGVEVRRVELPEESLRGGLLGQAAIHKITANGTTTSPVKRGVWVMDRLLDQPVPPPPPGISQVDPDTRGATTIRQQLDRHRSDRSCAACHQRFDPAGFALEAFDPIGGYRTKYRSTGQGDNPPDRGQSPWKIEYRLALPVDASGQLPNGRTFHGPAELTDLLAEDPKRLAIAFVSHLSRYATGTPNRYADREEIERIVESTRDRSFGVRSLIHAFSESPIFLSVEEKTR